MKTDKIILKSEKLGRFEFKQYEKRDALDALNHFENDNWKRLGKVSYVLLETDEEGEQYMTEFTGMNASAYLSASINDTELAAEKQWNNR